MNTASQALLQLQKEITESIEDGYSLEFFIKQDYERLEYIKRNVLERWVTAQFKVVNPNIDKLFTIPTTAKSYVTSTPWNVTDETIISREEDKKYEGKSRQQISALKYWENKRKNDAKQSS